MLLIPLINAAFPLGQVVVTANAHATLTLDEIASGLARHVSRDWGSVCPEDAALRSYFITLEVLL